MVPRESTYGFPEKIRQNHLNTLGKTNNSNVAMGGPAGEIMEGTFLPGNLVKNLVRNLVFNQVFEKTRNKTWFYSWSRFVTWFLTKTWFLTRF